MLIWDEATADAVTRHAEEEYPSEACGLLVGRVATGGRIALSAHRARNVREDRLEDRYTLDPDDYRRADEAARAAGLEIVGVYHSHPDHPARPSATDLEASWEGWSYVIVAVERGRAARVASFEREGDRFVEETLVVHGAAAARAKKEA